jgi:hypothetical protein
MKIPLNKMERKDVVPSRYRRMRGENVGPPHCLASIIERLPRLNQLAYTLQHQES